MARYSLSVMKLLLNTNQPTKQIISSTVILTSHIHRDQDQDVENTVLRPSQDETASRDSHHCENTPPHFTNVDHLLNLRVSDWSLILCALKMFFLIVLLLVLLSFHLFSSPLLLFLSPILFWGGTHSLCMPVLRPASQAGPMCNPREGTSVVLCDTIRLIW